MNTLSSRESAGGRANRWSTIAQQLLTDVGGALMLLSPILLCPVRRPAGLVGGLGRTGRDDHLDRGDGDHRPPLSPGAAGRAPGAAKRGQILGRGYGHT